MKRHQWRTWWDKDLRRNRIACDRCSAEKTKLMDTDINPNFFCEECCAQSRLMASTQTVIARISASS